MSLTHDWRSEGERQVELHRLGDAEPKPELCGHIARSQSNMATVKLVCTAEAEGSVLDCWRLGTGGRREKLLEDEAE